jgi:hypothetical protein
MGTTEIEPWSWTDLYKNDLIGLKKLDEELRVQTFLMGGDHL